MKDINYYKDKNYYKENVCLVCPYYLSVFLRGHKNTRLKVVIKWKKVKKLAQVKCFQERKIGETDDNLRVALCFLAE